MNPRSLEKNVRLYPWFFMFTNSYFWGSTFILFFLERVSLEQTLFLGSAYYAIVVALEVPSGYFSDRFGRRQTLIIASMSMLLCNLTFFFATEFVGLLMGQILLAVGYSFLSGTDSSFHHDSLFQLGKQSDHGWREAKVQKNGMIFRGLSAFVGGLIALWNLRNPYGLTAITSFFALIIAFNFIEPNPASERSTHSAIRQFRECFKYLAQPYLRWIFVYAIAFVVLVHIPFELFQPYIDLLDLKIINDDDTPFWTGTIRATGTLTSAFFAAKSIILMNRFGAHRLFMLTILAEVTIIGAMSLWLSPWVILLIVARTIPEALHAAPMNVEISPRISTAHRATYFSMQSMAGRLSYSVVLFAMAQAVPGEIGASWNSLQSALVLGFFVGLGFLFILWLVRPKERPSI